MFKGLEGLETRRMFALPTITYSSGVLTVKGGSQSDIITVSEQATTSTTSAVHLEVSTPYRNFYFTQDYTGVKAINLYANGKLDQIFHTGNQIHPKIYGGGGIDEIAISDIGTGSSYVDAGSGDDSVTLISGTPNPPGTSATTIHGGDGKDQIFVNTGGNSDSKSVIYGDQKEDTIIVYAGTNTIVGDGASDTYSLLAGNNTITDPGGNNIFSIGSQGDPSYSGGTNNITGGGGTDTFYAYAGINTLNGFKGNDIFNTYAGSTNTILGGDGTDTLYRHDMGGAADSWSSVEKVFVVA
jgi:Ca2+-binding RTX toxin-like protein